MSTLNCDVKCDVCKNNKQIRTNKSVMQCFLLIL